MRIVDDVKALIEIMPKCLKEYDTIFTGNVIAHNRMDGVGVLSREDAISYSVTGPAGRASGWACDVRKTIPTAYIPNLTSRRLCSTEGDSMARFKARIEEIRQSIRILEQLVDKIPKAKYVQRFPRLSSCPPDTGSSRWRQVVAHSVSTSRARRHQPHAPEVQFALLQPCGCR